jgi:phage baseplate assembly protein gpV
VVLRGVVLGDTRLRPATPVDIDNLGPELSGRYVVTEAIHRISRVEGYLTEISTAPPPLPERSHETVAVLGIVTSVDDPDGQARVQVKLPTIGDIESAWMEVLSVGAGSGKGLVALPDVDDTVLVLLFHGDPARGVVVGGMYGTDGPPDSGVVDGAIKRYTLITSGGHKLQLDDENSELVLTDSSDGKVTMGNQKIRIEDANGTSLEMTQQSVTLHSAAALTIEAPGQSIVIKGSTIDFETA